jgi:hypothetical protein
MSMLYAASGDMDEAFAWLKKTYEQRDASLVWSKVAPESDLLRSACRFQQFENAHLRPFPGSSTVERSAVNRRVVRAGGLRIDSSRILGSVRQSLVPTCPSESGPKTNK